MPRIDTILKTTTLSATLALMAACGSAGNAEQSSATASPSGGEVIPASATTTSNSAQSTNRRAAVQPVVVELFTSQGCSSCPPADRLMGEIAQQQGTVVITRPVTYWDRLGWRDTLARPENTELQRAYARTLGGRGRAYTPQAVVQGRTGLVGSRRAELTQTIRSARSGGGAAIAVSDSSDGGRRLTISGGDGTRGIINLIALDTSETVAIGRGENGGRSVTYTNVLKNEQTLGDWNGRSQSLVIPTSSLNTSGANRYAVIVRESEAGPIIAATYL